MPELLYQPAGGNPAHPSQVANLPAIVLVHGAWHSAWYWQPWLMPYLAQAGYDCYAPSLRGHGGSAADGPLNQCAIHDYVADVRQVVADLNRPVLLVGHSMGGHVVQKMLETQPALVKGAVLLASVPPEGVWRSVLAVSRAMPGALLRANLTQNLLHLVNTPAKVQHLFYSDKLPADQLRDYASRVQNESYRAFWDMLLLDRPRPRHLHVPVLVLGCGRDRIFGPAVVRQTARAYHTQPVIFPELVHNCMLEPGWQTVADTILAWVEQLLTGSVANHHPAP